uniref:Carboxypeptidase n=1 Tax=Solanum tuberosum TaxID=4113 RepID=M1A8X8_SOLTU
MGKISFFFLLFLSNFVASTLGKKQGDVLGKFYKAKQKNSAFYKSYYKAAGVENVELDKVILPQEGLKAKDWINKLPGQPPVKFQQYGGYVTVNQSAGRALYYYFTEAENSNALPLLLWLNGGPGCSSIAYGAMEELGPFRVNSDGKTLHRNRYAWNHAANVLFLESPAGVGFSYTNTSSDLNTTGDSRTANDNVVFLLNWLERFPEYKNRDFYISGESYAGHYVPQLAHAILQLNKLEKKTLINLKGIIIGNAVINDDTDTIGMYEYFASHALISDETYHDILNSCYDDNYNQRKCDEAAEITNKNLNNLDIYNIYYPLCKDGNLTKYPKTPTPLQIDPCSDKYIYAYMNRRNVQDALHANVTNLKYDWTSCSDSLFYDWKDSPVTIIPLLKESLANGVRVWIFSLGKKQSEVLGNFYKAKQDSAFGNSYYEAAAVENVELDKVILPQEGLKEKDWIKKLPGQPPVKFQQYGGYVTVDESAGRALYYYFTEAENSKSLPLLLWLNGVANVLFLETPAGVGFSYTNTSSDLNKTGDSRTVNDNVVFLLNWLERFPEYKNRDFYISGESYAGHYVPQLAHTILQHNKLSNKTLINLKGIIIGNAVINDDTDIIGTYEYYASHALISDETFLDIKKYCFDNHYNKSNCNEAVAVSNNNLNHIHIYNIYSPLCKDGNLTKYPKVPSPLVFEPCSDQYVHAYLNRRDVQDALHANVTNIKYDWESCSDPLFYNWKDSPATTIPLLTESLENGVRVWIFSGDIDGSVPVTSTKKSIKVMNLIVDQPWRSWLSGGEIGGYVETYKGGLTFATVRGAGHEVPSFQPARALSLISHFLSGTLLPGNH